MSRSHFAILSQPVALDDFLRYLIYQTAAVIQGVKPAELVTLKERGCGCIRMWEAHRHAIGSVLGIRYVELRRQDGTLSLLFYHQNVLSHRLESLQEHPLFQAHGYPRDGDCARMLAHLAWRFSAESIPHEVGLFLGYPEKDVEAFVAGRQDHCFCRYWKVYHDPDAATRLMTQIDAARQLATDLMTQLDACLAAEALHRNIA